jgi:mannosyltransferase OCH1-like enzyme
MIPNKIHYCWFGNNPKPDLVKRCIESWQRFDYEIIEINDESAKKLIHINPYYEFGSHEPPFVEQARQQRCWAYVADYWRFRFLYAHGGFSLDADVELVKSLDPYRQHSFVSGQEVNGQVLITATMGAVPNHPFCQLVIDYYNCLDEFQPIPNTKFLTKLLQLFVKKQALDKTLYLHGNGVLYPSDIFCPYDHRRRKVIMSPRTVAIHHFQGSWK